MRMDSSQLLHEKIKGLLLYHVPIPWNAIKMFYLLLYSFENYRFCFSNLAFFLRENVGSSPYTLHIDRTVYFLPYRKFAENDTCNALLNAVIVRFVVVQYRKNRPLSAEIK